VEELKPNPLTYLIFVITVRAVIVCLLMLLSLLESVLDFSQELIVIL
jgi:hypothetical protein